MRIGPTISCIIFCVGCAADKPYTTVPPASTAARCPVVDLIFYDEPAFKGHVVYTACSELCNFDARRMNVRASSLRVTNGTWIVCGDAKCVVLGEGDYSDTRDLFPQQVKSVRRRPQITGPPKRGSTTDTIPRVEPQPRQPSNAGKD